MLLAEGGESYATPLSMPPIRPATRPPRRIALTIMNLRRRRRRRDFLSSELRRDGGCCPVVPGLEAPEAEPTGPSVTPLRCPTCRSVVLPLVPGRLLPMRCTCLNLPDSQWWRRGWNTLRAFAQPPQPPERRRRDQRESPGARVRARLCLPVHAAAHHPAFPRALRTRSTLTITIRLSNEDGRAREPLSRACGRCRTTRPPTPGPTAAAPVRAPPGAPPPAARPASRAAIR